MGSLARSYKTALSTSSRGSHRSDSSYGSSSTVPSSVSDASPPDYSSLYVDEEAKPFNTGRDADQLCGSRYHPVSVTQEAASDSDLYDESDDYDDADSFQFDIPQTYAASDARIETRTTTPDDFPCYFPSQRRLYIRHDDTAEDGNMNLRVDTAGSRDGRVQVELFYLRMRDIEKRDFSFRRYCRDSGREVCHATRRRAKPAAQRPTLQRSVSAALASLRPKPHIQRTNSSFSAKSMPIRRDSGYISEEVDDDDDEFSDDNEDVDIPETSEAHALLPSNVTKLEFSNYAQVLLKRHGNKSSKRYDFEYWGSNYRWKRIVEKKGATKSVEFHLLNEQSNKSIASIVPEIRNAAQVMAEEMKGGWVPPCSLWISDPKLAMAASSDVAEVIVATGIMALVDDCIERHLRLRTKNAKHLTLPLTPLKMDMEYVGPKALVHHVFRRRNSGGSTTENLRDGRESRHSPLRFAKRVETY